MKVRVHLLAVMAGSAISAPSAAQTLASGQKTQPPVAPPSQQVAEGAAGDIIVTAQKRSERLRDVPVSITAASGQQLADQGVSSPVDLEKVVPGFTYQKSSLGVPVFSIRGIGFYDTFVGASPTVTAYVDQVPLPFLAMTAGAGLDVERLEVLKGPQGTLFGQNSTGGAINYIAAKPTDSLAAGFTLDFGRFNEANAEAFVSGPITSTLRARIAVRHEYRDPWQISQTRPNDRLGERNFSAGRLLLDWEPSSDLKFELNLNSWTDQSDTQAFQFLGFSASNPAGYPESAIALAGRPIAPRNPRIADWDAIPDRPLRHDDTFKQASLRSDYTISSAATLTSITSYADLHYRPVTDSDGTDFNNFLLGVQAHIRSFSQELRLAGDLSSALKYTVGANYERSRIADDELGHYTGSTSGVGPFRYQRFDNRLSQDIRTKAVFANADLKLLDSLTVQGGARYTKQDRNYVGCLADAGDGAIATGIDAIRLLAGLPSDKAAPGACVTLDDATLTRLPSVKKQLNQGNLSWRASLNWKPNTDLLLYANVTKGYKSGSFAVIPAVFASQLVPVTQESVVAYEVGAKSSLLWNFVQFSAAAFHYDYRDKQILGFRNIFPFGNLPVLQNVPKSRVNGGEIEATFRPATGLRISAAGTYVDSAVSGSFIAPDGYGVPIELKGLPFPNTPKWQYVSDIQYEVPLSDTYAMFVGGNVTGRSSSDAVFVRGDTPFKIRSYAVVDLRAGLESANKDWRVAVWGRNIFNKYYLNNVAHVTDTISGTTGFPATYGITLSYRYR